MLRHWGMAFAATLALLVGGAIACGDDDDGDESPPTDLDANTTTETNDRDAAAYCAAVVEALTTMTTEGPEGEDEASLQGFIDRIEGLFTDAAAEAPNDEAREATENLRDVFVEGAPTQQEEVFTSDEFTDASAELEEVTERECDFDEMSVTAVDYEFEDVPDEAEQGIYQVTLSNDGDELHEFALVRVNDEETELDQLMDELLALPDAEVETATTFIGIAFAAPGEETSTYMEIAEPGRYVAVCFIAEGTSSPETEGTGPPHAELGMYAEFTVE